MHDEAQQKDYKNKELMEGHDFLLFQKSLFLFSIQEDF